MSCDVTCRIQIASTKKEMSIYTALRRKTLESRAWHVAVIALLLTTGCASFSPQTGSPRCDGIYMAYQPPTNLSIALAMYSRDKHTDGYHYLLLDPDGKAYAVLSHSTDPNQVVKWIRDKGMSGEWKASNGIIEAFTVQLRHPNSDKWLAAPPEMTIYYKGKISQTRIEVLVTSTYENFTPEQRVYEFHRLR